MAAAQLTEDEAAVYDRQLRVWGVETQRKLTSARVLVINGTGVAAELCKNIVLAGVGSVSLLDPSPAAAAPPGNFLVPFDAPRDASVASASAATLSEMNPLVRVAAVEAPGGCDVAVLPASFLSDFRVVVLAGGGAAAAGALGRACRAAGAAFFWAEAGGAHGGFFADLGTHTCQPTAPKKADDDKPAPPPPPPRTLTYCALEDALAVPFASLPTRCNAGYLLLRLRAAAEAAAGGSRLDASHAPALRAAAAAAAAAGLPKKAHLDDAHIDAYCAGAGAESPAVAAIVGGVLAQEVLKAVSGAGEPAHNFFFFDTLSNVGAIVPVGVSA